MKAARASALALICSYDRSPQGREDGSNHLAPGKSPMLAGDDGFLTELLDCEAACARRGFVPPGSAQCMCRRM